MRDPDGAGYLDGGDRALANGLVDRPRLELNRGGEFLDREPKLFAYDLAFAVPIGRPLSPYDAFGRTAFTVAASAYWFDF